MRSAQSSKTSKTQSVISQNPDYIALENKIKTIENKAKWGQMHLLDKRNAYKIKEEQYQKQKKELKLECEIERNKISKEIDALVQKIKDDLANKKNDSSKEEQNATSNKKESSTITELEKAFDQINNKDKIPETPKRTDENINKAQSINLR